MAFGASIRALLDTYANCVSLLKAFGRSSRDDPDGGAEVDPRQRDHSRLRKSLKSDRSLVKRAYSSKLSESGSRFKEGDARAIKALDRILKRLKNAITGLLHTNNKKDDLHLDYGSLMTLSNASRHDAIKAIDGLSRRLRSPASASAVSSSAAKAPSTTKAQSRRKRKSSPDTEASRSKPEQETRRDKSPSKKSSAASAKTSKAASREHTTSKAEAERLRKRAPAPPQPPKAPSTTPHKTRPSRSAATAASGGTQRPATPKTPKAAAEPPQNRISMLSFSSDSTKLGEIPQRKWQRREEMVRYSPSTSNDPDDGGGSTEYGVRPMFPLRPYTVEVKERRFLGWFSRRREA